MRVMAAMSPGPAARMLTSLIAYGEISPIRKEKAPERGSGASRFHTRCSAPVAEQPQQHHEQVDEVEIERQRAHHRLAAGDGAVVHRAIHFLDPLRVPAGEAGETDQPGDR